MVGVLLLALSPGFAHEIRVDFDHSKNFSCYRTYSWATSAESPPPDAIFPNQLMQERIVGFIEEALAARGLKRVPNGGDLVINYGINVTAEPEFITFGDGAWGWGSSVSVTTVETIYKGMLVVDMVDAYQKKLVFQGTSTQEISSRPQKNTKKLAKAVNEIFKRYPSGP